jgi:hypothetical protein
MMHEHFGNPCCECGKAAKKQAELLVEYEAAVVAFVTHRKSFHGDSKRRNTNLRFVWCPQCEALSETMHQASHDYSHDANHMEAK